MKSSGSSEVWVWRSALINPPSVAEHSNTRAVSHCSTAPYRRPPHHSLLRRMENDFRPKSRDSVIVACAGARVIDTDVIVVGGGPVGLTTALAVRATGRRALVVEAGAADRVRPG